MSNWYLYYRLLRAIPDNGVMNHARMELQGVLIDLRGKAVAEWPGSTDQDIQEFFEHMANNRVSEPFSERSLRHLVEIEGWSHNA